MRSGNFTTNCATHYRESLLKRVKQQGLGRSKMHVLEALLRLRQAACHPGLIDATRVDDPSAKLDVLMEQLARVARGRPQGAGIFAIHQPAGDRAASAGRGWSALRVSGWRDARTGRRMSSAFQNDPECGLFLISLKAGGLGLNLTAAEYVFLLDPWWNPAVEAQAVDRAHRIGQTRPVFAYRLIARDTVEEKVLAAAEDQARSGRRDPRRRQQHLKRSETRGLGTAALLTAGETACPTFSSSGTMRMWRRRFRLREAVQSLCEAPQFSPHRRCPRRRALPCPNRSAANAVRSVQRLFTSEVEDKPWFYDREMWPQYLAMLAANGFNRFNLSFGIGYDFLRGVTDAYFLFAYLSCSRSRATTSAP